MVCKVGELGWTGAELCAIEYGMSLQCYLKIKWKVELHEVSQVNILKE